MQFGPYILDQELDSGQPGLQEVSEAEASALGRTFANERIFAGSNVSFLDLTWTTVLATANGQLYKVSLAYGPAPKASCVSVYENSITPLTQEYGTPERKSAYKTAIWQTLDYNIVLQRISKLFTHAVTITVTSGKPFKETSSGQVD